MSLRLLVVDDEPSTRFGAREFFAARGWTVLEASSAAEFWERLEDFRPDVVVLDYRLPDATALDLLPPLRERFPHLPAIILTGFGSIDLAVRAMQCGASQFLTKPVNLPALADLIERIDQEQRVSRAWLATQQKEKRSSPDPFLGQSRVVRQLETQARRVAAADSPVLLCGETGTGKGVLARWLHNHSRRASQPFVDVNCAALGGELLQSELFGHEKGAFTGALERKPGLLELAHGGTLFLDEIGDMEIPVQAKLLKVVEEQRFRRLGGVVDLKVDVRVISATHHDLEQAVERRAFRSDLYYRIATVVLRLPPLRERKEDIPLLAAALLRQLPPGPRGGSWQLSPDGVDALVAYDWPGNIRELRNVLERATLLAEGSTVTAQHLAFTTRANEPASKRTGEIELPLPLAEVEKRHILRVLEAVDGDVARAAEWLGVPRSTLYQRLQRYGVRSAGKKLGGSKKRGSSLDSTGGSSRSS